MQDMQDLHGGEEGDYIFEDDGGEGEIMYEDEDGSVDEYGNNGSAGVENFRFISGLGIEYYPIQDKKNLFYGLFLGVSLGFVYDRVYNYNHINNEFNSLFARFEVGKDWWLSDYWSLGVALNYTKGSFPDTFYSYEDGARRSYACHTFGLTVRIAY